MGSYIQLTWRPSVTVNENASDDWIGGAKLSGSAEGFNAGIVVVEAELDDEGRIATLSIDASSQTPEIGGQVGTDKNFLSRFIGKKLPSTTPTASQRARRRRNGPDISALPAFLSPAGKRSLTST